jgi:hypothetical protein
MMRIRSITTLTLCMLAQGASTLALQVSAPQNLTVAYTKGVFTGGSSLYAASSIAGGQEYALAAGNLQTIDNLDGSVTIEFNLLPFSPQQVMVNKSKESGFAGTNPLYNAEITNFTLIGSAPAATFIGPDTLTNNLGDNRRICLIPAPSDASNIFVNTEAIKDVSNDPTNAIRALAGGGSNFFAAVEANGGGLNDLNAGIAVISKSLINLINPSTTAFPSVFGLIDGGINADDISMYWDSTLNRLFVGLHFDDGSGTICALLVGYLNNGVLVLENAIDPDFLLDDNDIIGGDNVEAHVRLIRRLNTSTGLAYLVVQSESNGDFPGKIYALPLVTGGGQTNVGKIARKDNFALPIDAHDANQLTHSNEVQALIGGGELPITAGKVTDISVVGETVYVALANTDPKDATNEAGIFTSTALLDGDGQIVAWTPWQRVASTFNQTYVVGRDGNGQIWYVDNQGTFVDPTINTISTTQWELDTDFNSMNFGVRDLLSLPANTPGLIAFPDQNSGTFAFFVNSQQVLIQNTTRVEDDNATPLPSTNNRQFTVPSPLATCSVEISRVPVGGAEEHGGWVFVGGYNGVAVLRDPATGNGWPTGAGQGLDATLAGIDGYTFKEIGTFSSVRRLISTGDHLYVAQTAALQRYTMEPAKFSDTPDPLNVENLLMPPSVIIDICFVNDTFFVATPVGLFYKALGDIDNDGIAWTEFQINNKSMGPIVGFFVQKNEDGSMGNIWVLAGDITKDLCKIYRLFVAGGVPTLITEFQPSYQTANRVEFLNLGQIKGALAVHDQILYSMLNQHLGRTNMISGTPITANTINALKSSTITPDIGVDTKAFRRISPMVRLDGTGTLCIAGDWGITAQQK